MFALVPQAVCNPQWQDAIPRHRNPHQIHVTTRAPETTNTFFNNLNIRILEFTVYIYYAYDAQWPSQCC